MFNISLPFEAVLYPLLSILIYSVSLKGSLIFDDMEVVPNGQKWVWSWRYLRMAARPSSSLLMACLMKWPATLRGVHAANCWIHAFNAFLVEQLALALGADRVHALAAGLFFVAMPFAANTVSYMSGQANLLAATFGLFGSLAILMHHPWFSLPCLLFAYFSKEDGLGFAATFLTLSAWQAEWGVAGALVLALAATAVLQRKHLKRLSIQTGDTEMSAIGLPVSYEQPLHGLTVLFATLWRIPCWFLGLKQSPYHGSGLKK